MKKFLLATLTLVLLMTPLSAVQAQEESDPRYIHLIFSSDIVYVNADDYLVLRHGWSANTRGLVVAFLTSINTELDIGSEPTYFADGKDQYWGEIEYNEGDGDQHGNKAGGWSVNWYYPLGNLEPGEYEVAFRYWMDHPVTDGNDNDGDGHPDKPGVYNLERTFTIIVE